MVLSLSLFKDKQMEIMTGACEVPGLFPGFPNISRVVVGFPGGAGVKDPTANAGDLRDTSSIPGSGRSPGVGNSNPFQCS